MRMIYLTRSFCQFVLNNPYSALTGFEDIGFQLHYRGQMLPTIPDLGLSAYAKQAPHSTATVDLCGLDWAVSAAAGGAALPGYENNPAESVKVIITTI